MFLQYIKEILITTFDLIHSTSVWIVFSYLLAGLLRDVISPERVSMSLGNTKFSSIFKITAFSMTLPVCSCGSVPLGVSMYQSGAYAGPVLAFLASSPLLNPAALILSYGLLGKEITMINVIAGFFLSVVIGISGNLFSGEELSYKNLKIEEEFIYKKKKESIVKRIKSGMHWMLTDFALMSSKYIVLGMLFGGFLLTSLPQQFIQKYLGDPSVLSLWNVGLLASFMYVCAVGHIPFIAALIASGASPGVAITFLMAGAATNIPEIITLGSLIGKRVATMYTLIIASFATLVGFITNKILSKHQRRMNYDKVDQAIENANKILLNVPDWVSTLCTIIILIFFVFSMGKAIKNYFKETSDV